MNKPDGGVPEADHRPGQRDGEQHHQDEIDDAEAAGGQRERSSQISPAIEASTISGEQRARPVSGSAGAAAASQGCVRSSGVWCFRAAQDIAGGGLKVQSDDGELTTGAGALVCRRRARPKSAPSRSRRLPPGRCACAPSRARSAAGPSGWSFRGGCRRANTSACARHSWRAIPFPGQIWLRDGGPRRGRPGRPERPPLFRALSAPDRV